MPFGQVLLPLCPRRICDAGASHDVVSDQAHDAGALPSRTIKSGRMTSDLVVSRGSGLMTSDLVVSRGRTSLSLLLPSCFEFAEFPDVFCFGENIAAHTKSLSDH